MNCKDEPLTNDCDLDCGRGNLNFVLDTPFYYAFICVKFD